MSNESDNMIQGTLVTITVQPTIEIPHATKFLHCKEFPHCKVYADYLWHHAIGT